MIAGPVWKGVNSSGHEILFQTPAGAPLHHSTFNRMVAGWGKRVGVALHPHLFRHTYATGLVSGGVPLDAVQAWLGHEDLATTAEYLHTAHSHGAREALEAWSGTLGTRGSISEPPTPHGNAVTLQEDGKT